MWIELNNIPCIIPFQKNHFSHHFICSKVGKFCFNWSNWVLYKVWEWEYNIQWSFHQNTCLAWKRSGTFTRVNPTLFVFCVQFNMYSVRFPLCNQTDRWLPSTCQQMCCALTANFLHFPILGAKRDLYKFDIIEGEL